VSEEFLTQIQFENRLHRKAELRLYEYHYNQTRPHQGINRFILPVVGLQLARRWESDNPSHFVHPRITPVTIVTAP
ncbi:MAG: hypothetical protein ACKPEQ_21655, partial [Dolichospermum sp.]